MTAPDLTLYTDSSPNGFKITIALEELELPYTLRHVHIEQGEHRQPEFLKLNPHGRIPVLVDHATGITLFESAAILLYLAEKTAQLLPAEPSERWSAITWLMFHTSSMGPLLGQRVHFELFDQPASPTAIARRLGIARSSVYRFLPGADASPGSDGATQTVAREES